MAKAIMQNASMAVMVGRNNTRICLTLFPTEEYREQVQVFISPDAAADMAHDVLRMINKYFPESDKESNHDNA